MQISIYSSYFYDFSPEEMVKLFAGKGWTHAELSNEHSAMLLERGRPDQIGRQFKRFAQDHGMRFLQGHLWLTCDIAGADRSQVVEQLKRWLDLYQAIGIQAAVLHPAGYTRYAAGDDAEKIEEASIESLLKLTAYLEGSNTYICLENLFTHAQTCSHLLNLIERAGNDNLGICLDTGHLNLADRDQATFIRQAGTRLRALHITDNQGKMDEHILPFARGTVDWLTVVRSLDEIHYSGLFNYEIPGENKAPLSIRLAKLDYVKEMTRCLFVEAGVASLE